MSRALALGATGALIFALCSCEGGDPVRAVVDDIVEAVEDRDADAVAEMLASDFRTSDGAADRDAAARLIRQYLSAYRALNLDLSEISTMQEGTSAGAGFRLRLVGVPRELGGLGNLVPRTATYDFDLRLAQRDGDWRIIEASWNEHAPGTNPSP